MTVIPSGYVPKKVPIGVGVGVGVVLGAVSAVLGGLLLRERKRRGRTVDDMTVMTSRGSESVKPQWVHYELTRKEEGQESRIVELPVNKRPSELASG